MLRLLLAFFALAAPTAAQSPAGPRAALDALIAADRAFSANAAHAGSVAEAVAPMLDAEVSMGVPGRGRVTGRDAVLEVFRTAPPYREGTATWAPVRGGISADGTQGFTFGYLTLTGGDPARRNRKYLAYWLHRPEGWRIVAYRIVPRPAGEVSHDMMAPSLPAFTAAPGAGTAAHEASLATAERAFSDRAQTVGLAAAFREYARPDAMNMGQGPGFLIGPDAIYATFPADQTTSEINWSTDRAIVAASGDLGVSIGTIRPNGAVPEGQPAEIPFFTVWRRDAPDQPWRYIAE